MAKRGTRGDEQAREREAADRAAHGQSRALGDTGDGETGVAPDRQGISNRQADGGNDVRRSDDRSDAGDETRRGANADVKPGRTTDADDLPPTEAGAPPVQEQERSSLDNPSQSGRPRDEGEDRIDRTGAQTPSRSDPEAVRPPGSPRPDDNTM
jgi:hypothetical protein